MLPSVRLLPLAALVLAVSVTIPARAESEFASRAALKELRQRRAQDAERRKLTVALQEWPNKLAAKIRQNQLAYEKAEKEEERNLQRADRYFEKQDYRKAKDYYRRALAVSFYQWVLAEQPTAKDRKDEDFTPRIRRRKFRLATDRTTWAYQKLADIDRLIVESDLAAYRARADKAFETGKLLSAYRRYNFVLRFASRMGDNKFAARTIQEVKARRAEIIDTATAPLVRAEAALDRKEPAEALDAVEEFQKKYADFRTNKDVRSIYDKLIADPALQKEMRERKAARLLASAEAAIERRDYLTANRRLSAGAKLKDTRAGAVAAKKLDELMADPKIVKLIKLQKAEYECKGLMARARMLVKLGKPKEALAIYDSIVENYPDTPWPIKAAEAKAALLQEIQKTEETND